VRTYGEIDEELHYFRNKLNVAPSTLAEMEALINSCDNIDDKWIMCSPYKGRFHMFGVDGTYNIKFISSNNTDNIFEAVYDKNGELITGADDFGKNMGTYNFASSSKESPFHNKFDVYTYETWGNTINDIPPINDEQDNNITNDKDPNVFYDTTDYSAKNHYEEVCRDIKIEYSKLKDKNYSNKCYGAK